MLNRTWSTLSMFTPVTVQETYIVELYGAVPSVINLILHPQWEKNWEQFKKLLTYIQSEFLIRSLLGWASFCIVLESIPLHFSEIFRHNSHKMPAGEDRWVKPLESSQGSSSDSELFRLFPQLNVKRVIGLTVVVWKDLIMCHLPD